MPIFGQNPTGQLPSGLLGGESNAYVNADGVHVTDGTNERVRVGRLSGSMASGDTPTYGLKVWASDGTTVIIDGTSNMFKILSSGTLSQAGPDGTAGTAQVSTGATIATGLTYTPAFLAFILTANDSQGIAFAMENLTFDAANHGMDQQKYCVTDWEATNQTRIRFFWNVTLGINESANTNYVRYYLLQETAF